MINVVLVIGSLIVGLVLVQVTMAVYSGLSHTLLQKRAESLSLLLFMERIELARHARKRNDNDESWDGFRKFEVARKVPEALGICSFYLKPHDNKPIPSFKPGQFLTFSLKIPGREKPVVRCYSLSDGPSRDYYRVSIKKLGPPPKQPDVPPGLGSNFFHDNIQEGDIIDVRAPGGKFYLSMDDSRPAVFVAGGVGITPFISMMSAVIEDRSSRECWLFYGVRNGNEPMKKEWLRSLNDQHPNLHVVLCYSDALDHEMEGRDFDYRGYVSCDLLQQKLGSNNYLFYMCGPPGMMESMQKSLKHWGVPEKDIITESFGPASIPKPKPKPAAAAAASGLKISFSRTGKEVPWDGSHGSILDFAEASGVDLDCSCRAGSCGSCQVAIKSGDVEYSCDPSYDVEDGCCLTCICSPKGDLVLDA